MAGRPTSADIEQKRAMIEAQKNAHEERLDSMDAVQKQIADSLAVLDSLRLTNSAVLSSRQLTAESKSSLSARYYVIIGAFGKIENAKKLVAKAEANSYKAELIAYANGFTAVGVCASDNLADAYARLQEVRQSGFCPDAWILDNK
ncbi:MAG: SPOR domain-containing protein [Bacteroidales bacterium]|nr:SPOR domain-containing protein [Bacteroidales bacterium]